MWLPNSRFLSKIKGWEGEIKRFAGIKRTFLSTIVNYTKTLKIYTRTPTQQKNHSYNKIDIKNERVFKERVERRE